MLEEQMVAHVTKLHEAQQKKFDKDVVVVVKKEVFASIQVKSFAEVVDDTIVCRVIIDLTNISIMDKTGDTSNVVAVDEVEPHIQDLASKQSIASNEATSRDKGEHDIVIVYSTSSGPTPLNYAPLTIVTSYKVQDMIG